MSVNSPFPGSEVPSRAWHFVGVGEVEAGIPDLLVPMGRSLYFSHCTLRALGLPQHHGVISSASPPLRTAAASPCRPTVAHWVVVVEDQHLSEGMNCGRSGGNEWGQPLLKGMLTGNVGRRDAYLALP